MKQYKKIFYTSLMVVQFGLIAAFQSCNSNTKYDSYLFVYFTGNGPEEEAVRYALSDDGYNYVALNDNQPILDSNVISTSGGVRDPHILRGHDGNFYMVVTDLYVTDQGWNNYAMVLLKSNDLIHWEHTVINIPKTYPNEYGDVNRVWAPQTIYDEKTDQYMIYWSMLRSSGGPDIIYYAYANEDFTGLSNVPKQLFFSPTGSACIDGDIIYKDGQYNLFFKNESAGGGIRKAVSTNLTEGYVQQEGFYDQTDAAVEGSGIFKLIDSEDYILMYDMYTSGTYQFTRSSDLEHFSVIDEDVSMNFHPRHGTVIRITKREKEALLKQFGKVGKSTFTGFNATGIKKNNVVVDDQQNTIYIPVDSTVNFKSFNPQIQLINGAEINKRGVQDFSEGAVEYTVTFGNSQKTYRVSLSIDNNPVLNGFYADPEVLYSNKTGKYYIYPTSDGFLWWSGTYFKTFSSTDLKTWKDEGVILDLKKDVTWADRNAWAPAAIEKEIEGQYKYFYYFTAAQKIGVAVSDSPEGPFVDSGKPIVDFKPDGIDWGQEIDPDVFTDPISGKSYLYWGNGYMAVAELNEDMLSVKRETVQMLHPDQTFREGTEVFYRKGIYYFLWSEDDTRSPNYRVRYAISKSPVGPLTIPKNNIVIEKDPSQGIYGTGHNSVIKDKDSNQYYIVYHRFNRPNGITMGDAAGYNREVCVDKLNFNEDGSIQKSIPTVKGIY